MVWQDRGVEAVTTTIGTAHPHRTDEEIAGILRDYRHSGLSLLAYSRRQGLSYSSLLRWRARAAAGATPAVSRDMGADPGFVAVKIQNEEASGDYVLSWPGGSSLKIPQQFQTDSLRRLLSVLEAHK